MKLLASLILLISIANTSLAQEDKDVKEKDVPASVTDYVKNNYKQVKDLKYYKEIEGDTVFYEAFFKYNNDQYSLLLFPDGRLYETEVVIKFNELDTNIKEKISKDLEGRFSKRKIRSVQIINPKGELKYEIELRAKKGHHSGFYEVFYDRNGNFLAEKKEVLKSVPSNSGF